MFNFVRYYQNVDQSDDAALGKVYQLLYIDDTNPDMVIYYMSDNMKCNEQFIQLINGTSIAKNTIFVEVSSPTNKWKVDKQNLQPKIQMARGADGQEYAIPDLSMTSTTGQDIMPGKHVYFTAPKPSKLALPDLNHWRLSYIINTLNNREELEYPEILDVIPTFYLKKYIRRYQDNVKQKTHEPVMTLTTDDIEEALDSAETDEPTVTVADSASTTQINPDFNNTASYYAPANMNNFQQPTMYSLKSSFSQVTEYTIERPEVITLSDDKINVKLPIDSENQKDTIIVIDGKEYTVAELRERLKEPEVNEHKIKGMSDDTVDFIKNLISRSAKQEATTTIDIDMALPSVSTYRLIYESYGSQISRGFVEYLASMVPYQTLINALATGLKQYYDETAGILTEKAQDEQPTE